MKRLASTVAALSMLVAALAWSGAFASADTGRAHGFDRFLQRYEAANTAFVNGDPRPWLSMTAEKDPASIFGGFGGLGETGVDEVQQRYLLAARAFQPSGAEVDFEYLVKDVRGKLAYTVAIERCRRPLHRPGRATGAGPAIHDDLPLRQGDLEDRAPARGHDGRPRASGSRLTRSALAVDGDAGHHERDAGDLDPGGQLASTTIPMTVAVAGSSETISA